MNVITRLLVGLWIGFMIFLESPIQLRSLLAGGTLILGFIAGMIYLLESGFHRGNHLSERRGQVYPLSVALAAGFLFPVLVRSPIPETAIISVTLAAIAIGVVERFWDIRDPRRASG